MIMCSSILSCFYSYVAATGRPISSFFCVSDENVKEQNEPIEADKVEDELRHDPYSLPAGFQWDTLKIDDPLVVRS